MGVHSIRISAPVRFLFQQHPVVVLHVVSRSHSADAATHDHYILPRGNCGDLKLKAIAHLVADLIVLAFYQLARSMGNRFSQQRVIDRTACGHASRYHEFDKVPAVLTHAISP